MIQFTKIRNLFLICCAIGLSHLGYTQGLEDVIVETYYISDANDNAVDVDSDSNTPIAEGSTTYRVYVDMEPGYKLVNVFGNAEHPLNFTTSTNFFNNLDRGDVFGDGIGLNRFDDNTVALDSYLAFGSPTSSTVGVTKDEDTDGAVPNSDGALANTDAAIGILPSVADGMIAGSAIVTGSLGIANADLEAAFNEDADGNNGGVALNNFVVNGGAYYQSSLVSVEGPLASNRILVAQITTDGTFEFNINFTILAPDGSSTLYVAEADAGDTDQVQDDRLSFNSDATPGCTSATACNYNVNATEDDGTCIELTGSCDVCSGEQDGTGTVLDNDADDDGVCDADEIPGCQDATACNYNVNATDPGVTCEFATGSCDTCSGEDDGTGTVVDNDADDDGVCNADEIPGCQDATACNYNMAATDPGTCEFPDNANCVFCIGNATDGTGTTENQDADGDGVCDADEVPGCTDASADNYNAAATDEDGSCTYGAAIACDGVEGGLEDVIVETFYVADANDAAFDNGSNTPVAEGATTYRIYMDLAPGYRLVNAFGTPTHPLSIGTTTTFFNDLDRGAATGDGIGLNRFDEGTVAIDSYLAFGSPTGSTVAVTKDEDTDGAIANGDGILTNADAAVGIPLTTADGMIDNGSNVVVGSLGIPTSDIDANFDAEGGNNFFVNGGAYYQSSLVSVTGPTASNRVLLAQITTDGDLSFNFNVTVLAPDGSDERYVAVADAGDTVERQCSALIFPAVQGCTSLTACNYNAAATADDGSCIEPVANCTECDGAGGTNLIDADADGVCDADEVDGCTSATACNYNTAATDDDGTCVEPVDCETCSGETDGTGTVVDNDADNDGVCDADEIVGCQDDTACNYNMNATDAGTCEFADEPNCVFCAGNATDGTGTAELQDADGDGVCDADETEGCTNATACNYNASVTDDDGSCEFSDEANCIFCVGNATDGTGVAQLQDADGDGVCDADEVLGCTSATACNYNALATDDDGSCLEPDQCFECNATNDALLLIDSDNNGLCDALEAGCNDLTACNYDEEDTGTADCIYPVINCSICNPDWYEGYIGDILLPVDTDGDGVCDADEVLGCTSPTACNYNPAATETFPEACIEPVEDCQACNATNDGLVIIDTDSDGICDADEVPGCTTLGSCNFNPLATDDDGSCLEPIPNCLECAPNGSGAFILLDDDNDGICNADEVPGCTTPGSCNYNPLATDDDGSCVEEIPNCTVCDNSPLGYSFLDDDGDGICNGYEIIGCQSETACNYNPEATDPGMCLEPTEDCEECFQLSSGSWILIFIDADEDGVCDADEVEGCTDVTACNYDELATDDDGSCLQLSACGNCGEVEGCTDATACNYDAAATCDNGSCIVEVTDCLECLETPDGMGGVHYTAVTIDTDLDGICDADEIPGCMDPEACNYNPAATDAAECFVPVEDCSACNSTDTGLVAIDADGDGICDADEVLGCTNAEACNYNPLATDDDWSCVVPTADCYECNADNTGLIFIDTDGDGICNANEVPGCQSATACNYNPLATDDGEACIEPTLDCEACNATNDGLVPVDSDNDGICDADEVLGCTSPTACNYDAQATDDNGQCLEPVFNCYECNADNTGLVLQDNDGDGVCNAEEVFGCTSMTACNYAEDATEDDGSCLEPAQNCAECDLNTQELVVIDTDMDGVCDADEVEGCTSATACNYDALATDDNGTCVEPTEDCEECYTLNNGTIILIFVDSDSDGICDAEEVLGCTDVDANNYDDLATENDGSCSYDCIDTASEACESFEGGFGNWYNAISDDIDWTSTDEATPSYYTGPNSAADGDFYVYIEASFPNYPEKNAQLVSPCYSIEADKVLNFDYHMQGIYGAVGSLSVDVTTDNGLTWTSLWSAAGHQGVTWNSASVDLSAYAGQTVNFRLNGTTAFSWKGDIAVDDFCVVDGIVGCMDETAGNYNEEATIPGDCVAFTCLTTVTIDEYTCMSFESGLGDWIQSSNDDFDWSSGIGMTNSWGTGPDGASDGSGYLYIESSFPNHPYKTAAVNTPCFDFTTASNPTLTFDYSMFGAFVGSMYVQASTDGVTWDFVWWESGDQGADWNTATVDLSDYAGEAVVQLRFVGQTSNGWQGDMALDNVCMNDVVAPVAPNSPSHRTLADAKQAFTKKYEGETLQADEFLTTSAKVYPNPSRKGGELAIELADLPEGITAITVSVVDLLGKEVMNSQIAAFSTNQTEYVQLPGSIESGTYLVVITAGNSRVTERLIIAE